MLSINYNGFKHDGTNTFSSYTSLYIVFQQYYYIINDTNSSDPDKDNFCKKLYSEPLTDAEIKTMVTTLTKKLLEDIKGRIKK